MLARFIFLFILIVSEIIVVALLIKYRYQKKLILVWGIVTFVVGSIISVSIQTSSFFYDRYNFSEIDKNSLASNNQIYLEKNNEIRNKQIVDGFWLDDGEFLIYSCDVEGITNDIDINIPVGVEREIHFEKNSCCGIVEVQSIDQDFDFVFDLYSDNVIKILNNDINVNYGSIYENVVAQELKCHNFDLYYYNSKKNGEVDFIIEKNAEVIPIEVKSGKDYKRHVALENLLNNDSYNITKAYTLCQGNIELINNRIYLPIYMIMFMDIRQYIIVENRSALPPRTMPA